MDRWALALSETSNPATESFTASDGSLPDRCFAFVPDDVPSHRKLKLCSPDGSYDAGIIGAAKAALGKGYRGNRVQLPADARAGVIAKVNRAARSVGLDPIGASEIDPLAFDDPTASDVHVDGPMGAVAASPVGALNRMRARLKGKLRHGVKLTTADVDEAHRHAKRLMPAHASEADADSVRMCDGGDAFPKLAKADPAVEYRMASADNPTDDADGDIDHCGACRFFQWGRCQLVEGTIEADHVCSLFKDQPITVVDEDDLDGGADEADEARAAMGYAENGKPDYRIFQEVKAAAEIPARIPYLPVPGVYKHPSYGEVAITPERNARFVANFRNRVYGQDIPIDAEHQTKLSGAMGHIKELVQNSDGSVDAIPTWTPNGQKLLKDGAFRYFSPEWFDTWRNPADGVTHQDVPIGGALTNRPFFKEGSLRPLAASEGHLYLVSRAERGAVTELVFDEFEVITPPSRQGASTMAEDKSAAPVAMTEEQISKRFADLETKHAAELAALKTASEERAAKLAAEVETERAAREQAEHDARIKRFTDEVRGRSDSNGAAWIGDVKSKVATLDHLAKTAGEDSEVFKSYVADQRAVAAQVKDSALFKVFGSDAAGEGDGTSAGDRLNAEARKIARETGKSFAVAYDAAVTAHPKLYAEMRAASR